jgi:hypothetical protein
MIHQYQDWTPKKKLQKFNQKSELSVVPEPIFFIISFFTLIFIIPVLLASPSLFSYPYYYPLCFPSFSCATIYCSPSQLLFLSFSSTLPCLHLLSYPSPPCHHTTTLFYTLTTNWLAYCTTAHTTSPLQIPDTTTEIYPNTYKSHKTQQPLYLFLHPSTTFPTTPFLVTPFPILQNP